MSVLLSASAAGRWGSPQGCPGSAVMERKYPEVETSDIAREGTTAHALADDVLCGRLTKTNLVSRENELHPDTGVVIDATMIRGILQYVDIVQDAYTRMQPDAVSLGEHFVTAFRLHPAISGTADHTIVSPNKLHLFDFKYGFVAVEAEGNYQLISYLAGFMDAFPEINHEPLDYTKLEIELSIYQPRASHPDGPYRTWRPGWHSIEAHFNQLIRAAEIATGPAPYLRSGEHCWYCSAKLNCHTAIKAGMSLYEMVGAVTPLNPSPEYISVLYGIVTRAQRQIKFIQEGLDAEIKHRIKAGERIPGLGLETGLGNRRWKDERHVQQIAEIDGKPEWLRPVTPAQAERSGMDEKTLADLTHRRRTAPRIAVVDAAKAAKVFK